MKVKLIPWANQNPLNSTTSAFQQGVFLHEWSNSTQGKSISEMLSHERAQIFDVTRPKTFYRRMVKNIPDVTGNLLGTKYFQTSNPTSTQSFNIHVSNQGSPTTQANCIVTLYIAAKFRQ